MLADLWDKFWHNDDGEVVIFQWPNAWLIGWAVLTVLSLMTSGHLSDAFSWAGNISLVVWSQLEIWHGADYFRRLLGLAVFIYCVLTIIKSF